jgi:TPR repeat protein
MADKNIASGYHGLAYCAEIGHCGHPRNRQRAIQLYRKAANMGFKQSAKNLQHVERQQAAADERGRKAAAAEERKRKAAAAEERKPKAAANCPKSVLGAAAGNFGCK